MQRYSVFLCFFLILIGWMPSWLHAQSQPQQACEAQLRNKCGLCHVAQYACPGMSRNKGGFYWKSVVNDMIKEGMEATTEEEQRIVACLSKPDAATKALCAEKK